MTGAAEWIADSIRLHSRQCNIDESMISSDNIVEAMQMMFRWLHNAKVYLADNQPVFGDVDTVSQLLDHHQVDAAWLDFCQEINSTNCIFNAIILKHILNALKLLKNGEKRSEYRVYLALPSNTILNSYCCDRT